MTTLTIIAHITAKQDQVTLVKSALTELIAPTLAEVGCLQYDLHQDNDNPEHFMFMENWASRDAWRNHMDAPHLQTYLAKVEGAVESFVIHEMSQVKP